MYNDLATSIETLLLTNPISTNSIFISLHLSATIFVSQKKKSLFRTIRPNTLLSLSLFLQPRPPWLDLKHDTLAPLLTVVDEFFPLTIAHHNDSNNFDLIYESQSGWWATMVCGFGWWPTTKVGVIWVFG